MRTLSTLAMRTLSTLATLILDLAFVPIRIAVVESRWVGGGFVGTTPTSSRTLRPQAHDPELPLEG